MTIILRCQNGLYLVVSVPESPDIQPGVLTSVLLRQVGQRVDGQAPGHPPHGDHGPAVVIAAVTPGPQGGGAGGGWADNIATHSLRMLRCPALTAPGVPAPLPRHTDPPGHVEHQGAHLGPEHRPQPHLYHIGLTRTKIELQLILTPFNARLLMLIPATVTSVSVMETL